MNFFHHLRGWFNNFWIFCISEITSLGYKLFIHLWDRFNRFRIFFMQLRDRFLGLWNFSSISEIVPKASGLFLRLKDWFLGLRTFSCISENISMAFGFVSTSQRSVPSLMNFFSTPEIGPKACGCFSACLILFHPLYSFIFHLRLICYLNIFLYISEIAGYIFSFSWKCVSLAYECLRFGSLVYESFPSLRLWLPLMDHFSKFEIGWFAWFVSTSLILFAFVDRFVFIVSKTWFIVVAFF